MAACFGTGTIVDVFRQVGTVHCNREWLMIFVNTSPNSEAQSLRMRPGMPSGVYHLSRLDDECLAVGGGNWIDISLYLLHLEASKVLVELLHF